MVTPSREEIAAPPPGTTALVELRQTVAGLLMGEKVLSPEQIIVSRLREEGF